MAELSLRDRIGQAWAICKGFLAKQWRWLVGVVVVFPVSLLAWALVTGSLGHGFDEYQPTAPGAQRAKTLWDLMDLLLVPLLLALGAWLLNRAAKEREHKTELDRFRQTTLQTYLDRVSALIRNEQRGSAADRLDSSELKIIQVQTLIALRQLDGRRSDLLFRFLREFGLIEGTERVTLKGADLIGSDLERVDLSNADLHGASLNGAKLCGANLSNADLYGALLNGAKLCGANLNGAKLRGAKLEEADLSKAKLQDAKLHGAELMQANLSEADLSDAKLHGARLYGANLSGAKLEEAELAPSAPGLFEAGPADLGQANMRKADLRKAILNRADLSGADLSGADLTGTELRKAILVGAKLSKANLEGANLEGANLERARVTDEQLAQAKSLKGAILRDGSVHE